MEINEHDKIFGQFCNPLCEIERLLFQNGTQEILMPFIPILLCQSVYAPKSWVLGVHFLQKRTRLGVLGLGVHSLKEKREKGSESTITY